MYCCLIEDQQTLMGANVGSANSMASMDQRHNAAVAAQSLSHVQLFATPCTEALQTPLSMGFSRQEHWSWLSFPSPGDLPHPGIKLMSPALAGGFFTTEPPGKPSRNISVHHCKPSPSRLPGTQQTPQKDKPTQTPHSRELTDREKRKA